MRELNKKVLGIAVVLMAVAMLAVPVYAKPTKGNKVEVTLNFVTLNRTVVKAIETGNVVHLVQNQTWNVSLVLTDGTFINGTAFAVRMGPQVPQKDGAKMIIRDYYEFWFEDEGGGFEGHGLVMLDGLVLGVGWEKSRSTALFHGTEAFEGQTLNFGSSWRPTGGVIPGWTGYWLKP